MPDNAQEVWDQVFSQAFVRFMITDAGKYKPASDADTLDFAFKYSKRLAQEAVLRLRSSLEANFDKWSKDDPEL